MYNKENTSKLISYWLRHNPSDANLTVDEFGWASLNDLLDALKLRGHELTYPDIHELNQSFDKVRWEFDETLDTIRATHGHSIPIVLEDMNTDPPAILFHGTSSKKLGDILNIGLLPMQRQFVHLSATIESAVEVGKRHGKPILIEIDTFALIKDGGKFYQTTNNVWLAPKVPVEYLSFVPWQVVTEEEKGGLLRQLNSELTKKHILYDKVGNLELILRRHDCDDALFIDKTTRHVYSVHLTWQGKQYFPNCPFTEQYNSLIDWAEDELIETQKDCYNF